MTTTPPEPASGSGDAPLLTHQPKAQLFGALSVLWIFPSLGALVIRSLKFDVWRQAESWRTLLSATRFEQWIALLVLVLHPLFVGLGRHYRKNEVPQPLPPSEDD